MAYVALLDVRAALPQLRLGPTDKPNEGQVGEFVEQVEAYVNSALKGIGYTVPIVSADAQPIVRELVLHGVISRVIRAMNLGVRDPEQTGAAASERSFDRLLGRLLDPRDPLTLTGETITEKLYSGVVESQIIGSGVDPTEDPAFVRGQIF